MEGEDKRQDYPRHIQGVLHSIVNTTRGGSAAVHFGRISLPASEDVPSVSVKEFGRLFLPLQAEQEGKEEKLGVAIPMGVACNIKVLIIYTSKS
jgi:hypothetical protein